MKKNTKLVTGKMDKKDKEVLSLDEIVYGKKATKFAQYATREEYKKALIRMDHLEICEEAMRLGDSPRSEKEFMVTRCLELYDRAQNPRKITHPNSEPTESIEDVLARSVKSNKTKKV